MAHAGFCSAPAEASDRSFSPSLVFPCDFSTLPLRYDHAWTSAFDCCGAARLQALLPISVAQCRPTEVVIGLENLGMFMNAAVEDLGYLLIKLPLGKLDPNSQ